MAGTFSRMYIQIVFAVQGRQNLLAPQWRKDVFKYTSGIINAKGQKSIIVNGVCDHVHCFVGFRPSLSISDLVRDIKNNSSKFITQNNFLKHKFTWQEGYGVFSYSHQQVEQIYNYVLNQEEHHKTKTFKEEYMGLLDEFDIPYQREYLFEWIE
jgi:putative transposase